MTRIKQFQITGMTISGFKSYEKPAELVFGNPTTITGGNGRGKTSIADAIAFAVTGLPFFGERGLDRLHNEVNPNVYVQMRFLDENGAPHELTRTRQKDRMSIHYDGYEIRQMDLSDLFGDRDVFLSIFNPLYFIEELGDEGKNLLEMYLPRVSQEEVLAQLSEPVRLHLEKEDILSPEAYLRVRREKIRSLEERITYITGQRDQAAAQKQRNAERSQSLPQRYEALQKELAGLQEKRFSGIDVDALNERQMECSARYNEARRDGQTDDTEMREQLTALGRKSPPAKRNSTSQSMLSRWRKPRPGCRPCRYSTTRTRRLTRRWSPAYPVLYAAGLLRRMSCPGFRRTCATPPPLSLPRGRNSRRRSESFRILTERPERHLSSSRPMI